MCVILAIMIVWVGMYFQMQEVHSLFLCKPDGYCVAAIYDGDNVPQESVFIREQETSIIRNAILRFQPTKRMFTYQRERFVFNELITLILSVLFSAYLIATAAQGGMSYTSSAVILQFIHSKDGEK